MTFSALNTISNSDRHSIRRIGLAVTMVMLLCAVASGQESGPISLSTVGENQVKSRPGEVVTVGIRVTSSIEEVARCISIVQLPAAWRTLVGNGGFQLKPNSSEVRFFSFAVPRGTPAGSYPIVYEVRAADRGGLLSSRRIELEVESEYHLDVSLVDSPRRIVGGSPLLQTYVFHNRSNEKGLFRFRATTVPALPVLIEPREAALLPGEERVVTVSVSAESEIRRPYSQFVALVAMLASDTTIQGEATGLVEVVPRTTFEGSTLDVPLQLTLRSTGENHERGAQAELFGTGSLNAEGTDRYELLIRGPDNRTQSLLGWRDEYRLAYQTGLFAAAVGDQAFRLSPLTELGRYGFGIDSRFNFDRFTVGGFVNQTRWSPSKAEEFAGFASYSLAPYSSAGINFLQKREEVVTDILTLQGTTRLLQEADLSVEAGGSQSVSDKGKAIAVQLRSVPNWFQYSFNLIHADPGYRGYYRDFNAYSLSAIVSPWGNLRFEALGRNERRNLDLNPVLLHAPRYQHLQAGIAYEQYAAVYFKVIRRTDLMPISKYDQQENTVLMRFGTYSRSSSLTAEIDLGNTNEHLLGRSYPLRRFGLSARFQPDVSQGYSVSVEHRSEKDLFTELLREGSTWSVTAWFYLAQGLSIHGGVYQSWTLAPSRQMNTLADASIDYTFPFHHRLSLLGRINHVTSGLERDNVGYSVEYRIPFSIGFDSNEDGGAIAGRVIDMETGRGIPDLVLYAGDQVAVSDESGEFEFPNIRVGTQVVSMDRGVAGPDRISNLPLPLQLEVQKDQRKYLEIGITRSSSLTGEIHYGQRGSVTTGDAVDRNGSFAGIMVELTSEGEVFRRMTDYNGRFRFSDLRPGRWNLRVVEKQVPDHLRVETPSQSVDLNPGEHEDVLVALVPLQRRVRILQEGMLLRAQPTR